MKTFIDGDVLVYYGTWESVTLEQAQKKIDETLEKWKDATFSDDVSIAMGAKDGHNYRYSFYPQYKQTAARVKGRTDRADWFYDLVDYIASFPETVVGHDIEADDMLGHWRTDARGGDNLVITVDKDLRQLGGRFYNPKKVAFEDVSKYTGDRFFLLQMLMGDGMDKIPGLPRVGPKTAEAWLSGFAEEDCKGLSEFVLSKYKEILKDEWEQYFLANGKLLWIQRFQGDHFTLKRYTDYFDSPKIDPMFNVLDNLRENGRLLRPNY